MVEDTKNMNLLFLNYDVDVSCWQSRMFFFTFSEFADTVQFRAAGSLKKIFGLIFFPTWKVFPGWGGPNGDRSRCAMPPPQQYRMLLVTMLEKKNKHQKEQGMGQTSKNVATINNKGGTRYCWRFPPSRPGFWPQEKNQTHLTLRTYHLSFKWGHTHLNQPRIDNWRWRLK